MTQPARPILYSFRRCPYAMRARLALSVAGIRHELREVALKNKPAAMVALSPKATVPVLHTTDGAVLEQSLDIMNWALVQSDPENWLSADLATPAHMDALIAINDTDFKHHLDRYKYATRYEDADPVFHRTQAETFLADLESRLCQSAYLFGPRITRADIAIAPFVRQFSIADRAWFDQAPYPHLRDWVDAFQASDRFKMVMAKHPPWRDGDEAVLYPV